MVQASLVLASLFTLAYAGPHVQRKMHVVERRDSVPSGFVMDGAAPSDEVLTLRFALAQSDIAGLEKELYAVSTPGSGRYRQFLSKDEVRHLLSLLGPRRSIYSPMICSAGSIIRRTHYRDCLCS